MTGYRKKLSVVLSSAIVGVVAAAAVMWWPLDSGASASFLADGRPASQMAVFHQPALPTTATPADVARRLDSLPPSDHGRGLGREVRVLARDMGVAKTTVYAFPTERGAVCYVAVAASSTASCVPPDFPSMRGRLGNLGWMIYFGADTRLTVLGVAMDSVVGVDVVLNSGVERARLVRNSFFWESRDGDTPRTALKALIARQRDGTETRLDVDFAQ